ncbi:MAG: BTAD domain-containing putative transcriptional regulator [Gemmatimonadaceae bacterium]
MRLKTFGGLSLQRNSRAHEGAAAQRRRLALLALLAGAGERGLTRDKILGLLWPEADPHRARNTLSQALYAMRRDLGSEDAFIGSNEIRLNPAVVSSDVADFRDALREGRLADAIELYEGPFLDGFYLGEDAPEFERWVDAERTSLAHDFARALENMAKRAADAGDHAAASGWWRRLAALDPLSTRASLGFMRSLVATGDRAGALRHARVFEELLRQELDVAPDRALTQFVAELRAEQAHTPVAAPAPAPTPSGAPAASASPASSPPARFPGYRARHRWAALVIALVVVGGVLVASRRLDSPTEPPDTPASVAVLPFTVRGSSSLGYLSEGMVDLLSSTLDGAGTYSSIDPHSVIRAARQLGASDAALDGPRLAQRVRASHYVLGEVIEAGGRLRITATMYASTGENAPLVRSAVEGTPDELFTLVDQLTEELLTPRSGGPESRLAGLAAATTQSLPALKAYLEGEHHFRLVNLPVAAEAYQRALAQDSSFALAWYRLAVIASWTLRTQAAARAAGRAVALSQKLGARDRALLSAFYADLRGNAESAEAQYRSVLTGNPDDVEAWLGLGEVLFHSSWRRGRSMLESREPWERALALDPANWQARLHLTQALAKAGDSVALAQSLTTLMAQSADTSRLIWMRALGVFSDRDGAGQERVVGALRRGDAYWTTIALLNVAVYLEDIDGAIRLARLLVEEPHPPPARGFGHTLLAHLELARGRWDAAQAELALAEPLTDGWSADFGPYLATASFLSTPPSELAILRENLRAAPSTELLAGAPRPWSAVHEGARPAIRTYLLGLIGVQSGDPAAALTASAALDSMPVDSNALSMTRDLSRGLRARVAAVRGDTAAAVAALQAMELDTPFELGWSSPFLARTQERYLLAELLRGQGRLEEASSWYVGIGENSVFDLPYLAPSHLRRGEIAERRGDRATAAAHYRAVVRLWRDCDPVLRPLRARAQARLATIVESEGARRGSVK